MYAMKESFIDLYVCFSQFLIHGSLDLQNIKNLPRKETSLKQIMISFT